MNRAASNAVDPGSSHLNLVAAELRRVDSAANSLLVLIVAAASLQHFERRLLALLDLPKRDLEAVPDRDLALLELVERRLGLLLQSLDFELDGLRFLQEVLLEGQEVVGELLPEESAAGHERGLPLELVEARGVNSVNSPGSGIDPMIVVRCSTAAKGKEDMVERERRNPRIRRVERESDVGSLMAEVVVEPSRRPNVDT
ncbi:hypothetical protein ACFX1Q_012758 [Malus domestica]